ncbi:MAG: hypothetical protein K6A93_01770 [Bacteroidaceae bacterium]|nr:hypothetical protein [Bacteroidaceae bacterium]
MQYISFDKDRLPFKPKTNVVIYFDVMHLGAKKYYHVLYDFYDVLVEEFRRGGLEFCFLPMISEDMDLGKIYRYFNPDADANAIIPRVSHSRDSDLLEYVVAGFDASRLQPGLIQYKGEDFDKEDTYTYAFTPMTDVYSPSPYEMAENYIRMHGVSGDFFGRRHDRQLDRLRCEEEQLRQMRIEEACREDVCAEPPSNPSLFDRLTSAFRARLAPREKTSGSERMVIRENDVLCEECRSVPQEEDVEAVMSEVQMLVERLRQSGVGEWALQQLFQPTRKLSRLHVRYGRIFLPDYNNVEIKMPPLSKAIYLLYLHHPEGIKFSYLPEYRKELLSVYEMISGRDSREDIRRSIDDVTDPTRNSINEKCSRIKQAFLRVFDDSIARNYYITGERGEAKKILLPQDLIVWENFR